MTTRRRLALLGLLVFLGIVVFHSLSPYGFKAQTQAPVGVAVQTVSYTCGAPWGSAYVHGPATTAYPLTDTPCGERTLYQAMSGLDVLIGLGGVGAVLAWRGADSDLAPEVAPEVAPD